jgi:hypothetical protein
MKVIARQVVRNADGSCTFIPAGFGFIDGGEKEFGSIGEFTNWVKTLPIENQKRVAMTCVEG